MRRARVGRVDGAIMFAVTISPVLSQEEGDVARYERQKTNLPTCRQVAFKNHGTESGESDSYILLSWFFAFIIGFMAVVWYSSSLARVVW